VAIKLRTGSASGLNRRSSATAATTTTVPAAATTTTTTAVAATSRAAATAAAALFSRPRFIDGQGSALEFFAIKHRNGFGAICFGGHFDESKPARTPGRAVLHDIDGVHTARLREQVLQVVLDHVKREIPNE
jgi:hypothetical protein